MRKYHDLSSGNPASSKIFDSVSSKPSNDSSYSAVDYCMFEDGYSEGIKNIVNEYGHKNIQYLSDTLIKNAQMEYIHKEIISDPDHCNGEIVDEAGINILEMLSWVIGGSISKYEMMDKIIHRSKEYINSKINYDIHQAYWDDHGDDYEIDFTNDHKISEFI